MNPRDFWARAGLDPDHLTFSSQPGGGGRGASQAQAASASGKNVWWHNSNPMLQSLRGSVGTPKGRYTGLALGAGLVAGELAGVDMIGMATLNPMHSLMIGGLQANTFQRTPGAGLRFGGAFGYKTLFRGVDPANNPFDTYSLGNAMLSGVETGARFLTRGVNTPGLAALSRARSLGLATISDVWFGGGSGQLDLSNVEKNVRKKVMDALQDPNVDLQNFGHRLVKEHGKEARKIAAQMETFTDSMAKKKPGWFVRTLAGLGGESYEKTRFLSVGETESGAVNLIRKAAGGTPRVLRNTAGTILGKGLAFAGYMQLLSIPLRMVGGNVQEGVISGGKRLMRFVDDYRSLELGTGVLPQSFQTFGAATERQRALQSIYASRVSPSNRLFGNEAVYLHRR